MKWIKCSYEMPKKNIEVLLYLNGKVEYGSRFLNDEDVEWCKGMYWNYSGDEFCNKDNVSHWMPLPEPPDED